MWLFRKRARGGSARADTPIELTVPGLGGLVMDARTMARLRSVAADAGSSGMEVANREGDLAIVLFFPRTSGINAAVLAERFRALAFDS